MRRLQTQERHTDCTCRKVLGRRNRYVHSAQTIPNRNARRNFEYDIRGLGHGGAFLFCSKKTQINNITTRSKTVRRRLDLDTSAAQSGAAEFRNAVRCSASWPIVGTLGTPAVNKSEHNNLRFFCGGSFLFASDNYWIYNTTIRSRTVKQGINRYVSAAQSGAAEFHDAAADFFRSSTRNRRRPPL